MAVGRQTPQCGWEHGCWGGGAGVQGEGGSMENTVIIGGQPEVSKPTEYAFPISESKAK